MPIWRINLDATKSAVVGTAAVTLLPDSQDRRYLLIQNLSANTVALTVDGSAPVVGAVGTITLAPGALISWDHTFVPTNQIRAIASAINSNVTVIVATGQ